MPKMTKKGQSFVGREIGRMIRKGPSKGSQKGKKMKPKQAVAVALNVARKKGYKIPPRTEEAMLLRGPDYGALGLIFETTGTGVVVYDHNLIAVDKRPILAVLEAAARPSNIEDGGVTATFWRFGHDAHPAVVESNLRRAISEAGYVADPLAGRTVTMVGEAEARTPDLPMPSRFNLVHEPLEAGLRRHVEVAVAALSEHGPVTPPTVRFYSRPHATDSLGRPLPFLLARAFAEGDRGTVETAIREALAPVRDYLVRATVTEHADDEPMSVDIALAPPASVCEAYMEASIPTFESMGINGARTVWIKLDLPLEEDGVADIAKLCSISTGAVGFRTEREGRAVVAHIPSCNEGHHVADHAFQERLGWLLGLLDPWDPEVYDISEQGSIAGGAPGEKGRILEADVNVRRAQRAAATGDPAAQARLDAMLRRAGQMGAEPRVPSGMDADAIRDLELYLDNSSKLYPQRRSIHKNLIRKIKKDAFQLDLSAKLWQYWVDAGARAYVKEMGGSVRATFPKTLRAFLSMRYARDFLQKYRDGEITETEEPTAARSAGSKLRAALTKKRSGKALLRTKLTGRKPRKLVPPKAKAPGDGKRKYPVPPIPARRNETFAPTHGMANAAFGVRGAARVCKKCGVGFPKYRGRYPTTCPKCKTRGSVVMAQETSRASMGESLSEDRKNVGSEILGRPYTMNVANISAGEALAFAKDAFERAGLKLYTEVPGFDRNFMLLKRKMRHALDIPRIQMPVIEPADLRKFEQDLKKGKVDIFKPYASGKLGQGRFPWWPELRGGKPGKKWLTLGTKDGDASDDIVVTRPGKIPVKNLMPLQGEIWFDKLIGSLLKFGIPEDGGFLLTNATIIVSQEGYILDGHHRFGQAMLANPNLKIKAVKVPMDIRTLLKVGRSYGSAVGNAPKESILTAPILRGTGMLYDKPNPFAPRKVQLGDSYASSNPPFRRKGSTKLATPPHRKNSIAKMGKTTGQPYYDDLLKQLQAKLKAKKDQTGKAKAHSKARVAGKLDTDEA